MPFYQSACRYFKRLLPVDRKTFDYTDRYSESRYRDLLVQQDLYRAVNGLKELFTAHRSPPLTRNEFFSLSNLVLGEMKRLQKTSPEQAWNLIEILRQGALTVDLSPADIKLLKQDMEGALTRANLDPKALKEARRILREKPFDAPIPKDEARLSGALFGAAEANYLKLVSGPDGALVATGQLNYKHGFKFDIKPDGKDKMELDAHMGWPINIKIQLERLSPTKGRVTCSYLEKTDLEVTQVSADETTVKGKFAGGDTDIVMKWEGNRLHLTAKVQYGVESDMVLDCGADLAKRLRANPLLLWSQGVLLLGARYANSTFVFF